MNTQDLHEIQTPDQLFVGLTSKQHQFYDKENLQEMSDGKARMYASMLRLILEHCDREHHLKFLSMPGKFWRFELRLGLEWEKVANHAAYFTGFERDYNVVLAGAGYVPRKFDTHGFKKPVGFRSIESLRVQYFKTNRARFVAIDTNTALTLTPSMFRVPENADADWQTRGKSIHQWWIEKFCQWNCVWLDYYGPCSKQIGDALSNLHWQCRPTESTIPVGVTVLKGREVDDVADRRAWLEKKLSGNGMFPGLSFDTLDYFEYSDGGSTMCNILGLIRR